VPPLRVEPIRPGALETRQRPMARENPTRRLQTTRNWFAPTLASAAAWRLPSVAKQGGMEEAISNTPKRAQQT